MYDVGQGPVVFEKSFTQVPKPPQPSLGSTMSGLGSTMSGTYTPGPKMMGLGVTLALGTACYAVLKDKKKHRARNAKFAAGVAAFSFMIINS